MSKKITEVKDQNTEQLILSAARSVFTKKGFAAARMDDIAQEAGINRALLHYYFRSKGKMFDVIFQENLKSFYANFLEILSTDLPIRDKIHSLVYSEIDTLLERPELPLFILNEIARNPDNLDEMLQHVEVHSFFKVFVQQMKAEIAAGNIRPVDPRQFIMSLMATCIFPFIAKPMLNKVMGISETEFKKVMLARKEVVSELLIASLEK